MKTRAIGLWAVTVLLLTVVLALVDDAMAMTEQDDDTLHRGWTSYGVHGPATDLMVTENAVWVRTPGGIFRWDIESDSYTRFALDYGLASNTATSMAEGPDGSLWFGTPRGVSRLDAVRPDTAP
jgi:hypothetical protein